MKNIAVGVGKVFLKYLATSLVIWLVLVACYGVLSTDCEQSPLYNSVETEAFVILYLLPRLALIWPLYLPLLFGLFPDPNEKLIQSIANRYRELYEDTASNFIKNPA